MPTAVNLLPEGANAKNELSDVTRRIAPRHCHPILRASINVPCGIKSQICTIEDRLVRKIVGRLHSTDVATLQTHLRHWLGL